METIALAAEGRRALAALNAVGSVVACLAAAGLGLAAGVAIR
jgi:fluoride ion exporter CrcB/FEX